MKKDNTDDLDTLVRELAAVVEEAVEEALPRAQHEDAELRDLEEMVQVGMRRVGRRFLQLLVEACRPEEEAATIPCRCGGSAEFERHREGTILTTVGQTRVTRAYYLCPECHEGTYPLDERLGICAGGLSAALQEAVALMGIHVPFEVVSEMFERLTGVSISDNGVRESTERMGQERLEAEQAMVEAA